MKISFTGAQSTGKTTLLQIIANSPAFRKWSIVHEVTRKVKRTKGVKINNDSEDLDMTQLYILNEHLNNYNKPGNMVLDRCILDGYIYTRYLHETGKVNKWVLDYAENLLSKLLPSIDILYYPNPHDVDLHDDGVRSTDYDFREGIIQLYNEFFEKGVPCFTKPCPRVVVLSGDVPSRLHTITESLKK